MTRIWASNPLPPVLVLPQITEFAMTQALWSSLSLIAAPKGEVLLPIVQLYRNTVLSGPPMAGSLMRPVLCTNTQLMAKQD